MQCCLTHFTEALTQFICNDRGQLHGSIYRRKTIYISHDKCYKYKKNEKIDWEKLIQR